jgi:hypothetical protein
MTVKALRGRGMKKKTGTPRLPPPSAPRRPYGPGAPSPAVAPAPMMGAMGAPGPLPPR